MSYNKILLLKKTWIIICVSLVFASSALAKSSNDIYFIEQKDSHGEYHINSMDYIANEKANFISIKSSDHGSIETFQSDESTYKDHELELNFKIDRSGMDSGNGGGYMIAAFMARSKVNNDNAGAGYSKANFLLSGKLCINNSPIEGEIK